MPPNRQTEQPGITRDHVTQAFITLDIDDGSVLLKRDMELAEDTYIEDVYAFTGEAMPDMFADALAGLAAGTLVLRPDPTDPTLALRCYPRRPENSLIDWQASVVDIHRLIRASSRPFAGAFSTLEGEQRVSIWRANIVDHPGDFLAVPAQVCFRLDADLIVAASDGVLRLTEVDVGSVKGEAAKVLIYKSLRNRLI